MCPESFWNTVMTSTVVSQKHAYTNENNRYIDPGFFDVLGSRKRISISFRGTAPSGSFTDA